MIRYPSIFSILKKKFGRVEGVFQVLPLYFDYSPEICSKDCHCTLHFHT